MKNFNLSLNKYIYLVYRMFGDRTWDRIGYLICIVRDRLSTDFEKLGGCHTPPHPPPNVRPCIKNLVSSLYTDFQTSIITEQFNTSFITVGRGVLQAIVSVHSSFIRHVFQYLYPTY